MATEGDLKDLRLPNLIQTICLDQRSTIVKLKSRQQSGLIACNGGQVIHAEVGSLKGEEAVFELLSWTDGSFRLAENLTQTPRTISQSWMALLMEGMRRLDERRTAESTKTQPVVTAEDTAKDNALESKLILLFSSLEQMRVRLGSKEAQKNISLALQILAELVNQTAQFSETEFWGEEFRYAEKGTSSLSELLADAEDEFPLARVLQVQHNRVPVSAVSKLCAVSDGDPSERRETLRQVARAMVRVAGNYFSRFFSPLRTPDTRAECEEVVNVFLTDLGNLVDQLPF